MFDDNKVNDEINKISQNLNIKREDVEVKFKEILDFRKEADKNKKQKEKYEVALSSLRIFYLSETKSGIKPFEVVFTMITPIRHVNRKRINEAMKMYNENKNEALKQGLIKIVNDVPIVMDTKMFLDGKGTIKNGNYGKELKDNETSRAIFGLIKHEGKTMRFRLELRNEYINKIKVPLLKKAVLRTFLKEITEDTLILSPRKETRIETVEDSEIDAVNVFKNFYKKEIIEIKDFENVVANLGNTDFYGFKIIKGQVKDINLDAVSRDTGEQTPYMSIYSESSSVDEVQEVRVNISPEWIEKINFGEFSNVYVAGRPYTYNKRDGTKVYGMSAYAIVAESATPIEKKEEIKEEKKEKKEVLDITEEEDLFK